MLETILNELQRSGCVIEESEVKTDLEELSSWQSTVIKPGHIPVSGGFSRDRMQARKIAIAEYIERQSYYAIRDSNNPDMLKRWGLDLIPTACGFAAGFDKQNTILRSIHEAIERWVMSKWIDESLWIPPVDPSQIHQELDPVSQFFVNQFDDIFYFRKDILVSFENERIIVPVAQTMAIKDNGIYPGSSAQFGSGNLWQHALLESFRHLLLVRNNPVRDVFPDNKVRYFSENKDLALKKIFEPKKQEWPTPELIFSHSEPLYEGEAHLARTIFSGWRSWDDGPLQRFLY